MKSFYCFFLLVVFFSSFIMAERITVFSEPANPTQLLLDGEQIYVVDFPHIYVYSAKNFSLIKKIGDRGEGPKQFLYNRGSLVNKTDSFTINLQSDLIVVSSQRKVAFYTKTGKYLKEILTEHRHDYQFSPLDRKFIALTQRRGDDGIFYVLLNIYNAELKREKEIFKFKRFSQPPNGDINVINDKGVIYSIYQSKIFVSAIGRKDSIIDVLNPRGEKMYSLAYEYENLKVTDDAKKKYLEYYKAGPLKAIWDRFKSRIKFPTFFPGVRNFIVADEEVYVLTFNKKEGASEFVIFNSTGAFLRKVWLPLAENDIHYYPYTISRRKLYQLIENVDQEQYELHVCPIKK